MAQITFNVFIHEEDDGSYWAEVKELPGCFASGFSWDEVKEAAEEAMRLWLPEGIEFKNARWSDPLDCKPKSRSASKRRSRKMLVCA